MSQQMQAPGASDIGKHAAGPSKSTVERLCSNRGHQAALAWQSLEYHPKTSIPNLIKQPVGQKTQNGSKIEFPYQERQISKDQQIEPRGVINEAPYDLFA